MEFFERTQNYPTNNPTDSRIAIYFQQFCYLAKKIRITQNKQLHTTIIWQKND